MGNPFTIEQGQRRIDRSVAACILQLVQQSSVQERQDVLYGRPEAADAGRLVALDRHRRLRGIQRRLTKVRNDCDGIPIECTELRPIHLDEPDVNAHLWQITDLDEREDPATGSLDGLGATEIRPDLVGKLVSPGAAKER